jgi:asparagine synthase (glutamine-hydrolysing)
MCGFAGLLGKSARVDERTLGVMAAALAHRGPDDEGVKILPVAGGEDLSLGLVHRRLSVIDLSSAGHQPMLDDETGNWIVYNGEIYNHRELRTELEQRGCTFRSRSDTEVILKAYGRYGTECLDRLRGMFAFALWDPRRAQLFLAVDRFGIKPLYAGEVDGLFVFASELRTLLQSRRIRPEVEPRAVESFLAYGAVQAPLTMVKDIYALLPGQALVYRTRDRSARRFTYWRPAPSAAQAGSEMPAQTFGRMREILADSVEQHLVSDVPVGLFLSGGIDSSAVVALANQRHAGALQSFSVNFSEDCFSEQRYSDLVASRYCRDHTRIRIAEEDLAGVLPGALPAMDQPTIDGINVYTIAQAVRRAGIKVVLSGQGGDEVFGGYPSFRRVPQILAVQAALRHLPRAWKAGAGNVVDLLLRQRWLGSKIAQLVRSDPDRLAGYLVFRQLFSPRSRAHLLRDRRDPGLVNGVPVEVVEDLRTEIRDLDAFSCLSVLELRLFMANTLLRDGDFMSMAHALEVRVPLLDHRIVEFVFGVAPALKAARDMPKPLLVRALGELLAPEIWQRRKMGFTFPWDLWLRRRLRPQVEELLHRFPADNALGLDMATCRAVWDRFRAGAPGVSWARAWALYVLLSWYERNMGAG